MIKPILIDESKDKVKFRLSSILSEPIEIIVARGVQVDNRITLNPGQDEFEISQSSYTAYLLALNCETKRPQYEYKHIGMSATELLESIAKLDNAEKLVDKNDYGHEILTKLYKAYSSEGEEEKRLKLATALKRLQKYFNDTFVNVNYNRSCQVLDTGIFIAEALDDSDADNIEIDGEEIIRFNGQKTIKRKLNKGIHLICVYNDDHELLQRFFYVALSDEDNKVFDEDYANKNKLMDSVVTEEDETSKILQTMNYFDIDTPILPIPKIEIDDDKNLIITIFPSHTEYYSLVNYFTLSYNNSMRDKHDIILCLSEMDELFNKKANYRKFIYEGRSHSSDNCMVWFDPQLNQEKYFYWLEDEKGTRLSTIGVFDPTEEDETDYNVLFAKIRFNKHYEEYMRKSSYQDKIHAMLEEIRIDEDLPYINVVDELKSMIAASNNPSEKEVYDLINYCEGCLSKYSKKFDHELLDPIVIKDTYDEIALNSKTNDDLYIILNSINYRQYEIFNIIGLNDYRTFAVSGLDNIRVIRFLDATNWTISRPIIALFDKNSKIKYINTNGLEKEVINGL